ncbi:WD40-repeat-containing domain protein [Boletus edulis BED1]|uniref:WD40-repeat-containing domain protein n=1 Tax=Boletus edulis BED1 TaxID=1328754 RepID=A0AAD4BL63_BOLED|nr:WD40-repeat-containing domain protein [Boletus edulis BED1]
MLSLSLDHLSHPRPIETFGGHSGIVWSVVFLPNGKGLVSASNDGSIRLWNLDNTPEMILGSSNGAVFCLALFPDGKRLASGGLDRSVNVWDVDVLAVVDGPWKGHTSSVRYLDVSSDCRYLASGSFDHNVNIWDTKMGRIVRDEAYLNGDGEINCVKFSKKDRRLLTGSRDGGLHIWDWESGRLLVGPMKADGMPIWAVDWSRDETQILSGSSDGMLCRWHASTGRIIGEPVRAHESIIYSLSVSHNGGCLASASSDSTVKIWNTTTFEQMAILAHPDEVNCIAFSTDDRLLATACSDSFIYVWELPQASLDSGLVIDRECEGAPLLERPMVIPPEGHVPQDGRNLQRNAEMLREILDQTQAPPISRESTDLYKEKPVENSVPAAVEKKPLMGRLGFAGSRRRSQGGGVNNIQEPMQRRRKLSQMIKSAVAKSRKFIFNLW